MSHAEKCPICGGSGKLPDKVTCHGCGGKGWVEVGKDSPYIPRPPYPHEYVPEPRRTYPHGHVPEYPWFCPCAL